MESHLLANLYRLRYIERWSLMRNVMKENVAEHSFHVSVLTHCLCSIANVVFNKEVNTERAVTLSLFHDVTEVFTGDIPTPVKHHNRDILKNFRDIEELAAEKLTSQAPEELREVYRDVIQKQAEEELSRYIKAADLLDAYLKCATELSAGNREFVVAKKQIEEKINSLNMPEVEYFLTHLAPSFEKTLDEISE
ncbi:5'-deoxynucleotidase [Bacillus luteolus]|uniref:5'-deoxynucleotidase n=1 Tax=Litchfieldia luteola TaxID=682179 RepID=A0ABR9QJZ1_9BACI|nr:5'-deoxynucleotidase [Cytobacillus luteolus]MBE4908489.1 5'-deoxynucleotidase [Cytobacillus luteolus]MBP1941341.1 5'-deoxynucleotidase [Cytobacillus luteolus]